MVARHHASPHGFHRSVLVLVAALTIVVGFIAPAGAEDVPSDSPIVAPECPLPSTPNGRYVHFIYASILHRCPDEKAQPYWTNLLDGGLARSSFTAFVDMSDENVGVNNVDELYDEFLGRAPTPEERSGAIDNIRASEADAALVAVLVASDQYYDGNEFDDDSWLEDAYNTVLERDPDGGGATYYLAMFGDDGSDFFERFRVAFELERSTENAQGWVQGIYVAALQRPPSPDELALQVAWLQGPGGWRTFRLWTNVLATDEAYAIGTVVVDN